MSDSRASDPVPFSRLYPILDADNETEDGVVEKASALARAGCRLLQLRAKTLSSRELHHWAEKLMEVSRREGLSLIINDRVDVALLVGAGGVHLGQDDLPPESARELLGEGAIIGLSTHDVAQARAAQSEPVDYVAIGPVFESITKTGAHPALGLDGVREVRAVVTKPLVAIGGITLERARAVLDAGADGVAVISALQEGSSLEELARKWLALGNPEKGSK